MLDGLARRRPDAHRCRSSVSAPTATTSRSAAAARCCGCSPSARARRSTGWCSRPNDDREAEARASAADFLADAGSSTTSIVHRFRESYFPFVGDRDQGRLRSAEARSRPTSCFTHRRADDHQDHRTIAELTWNTFRDHLVARVRDPQVRGRPRTAERVRAAAAAVAERKVELLMRALRYAAEQGMVPPRDVSRRDGAARVESNAPEARRKRFTRASSWSDLRSTRPSLIGDGHEGARHGSPGLHRRRDGAGARRCRPRGRRARHRLLRRVRLRRPPDDIPELERRSARREPDHLARLRRSRPPGRAVQRPARRTQPQPDLRHQPARLGAPGRGGQGGRRRALPVLVVVQPVRRRRRRPARRAGGVQPGHRLRRVEGAGRAGGVTSSPTTRSRPCTCATPRPTACRAACAPTSSSTTSSATPSPRARCCCRATARRGARSCTSATSSTRSPPASRRRARRSTTRRSTSARTARTTRSATSPTWSPRSCPTARSPSPRAPRPTPATTGSTSRKIERQLPGFAAAWTLRQGIEELYEAYTAAGLTADDWTSDRYYRLRTINSLRERGVARRRPALRMKSVLALGRGPARTARSEAVDEPSPRRRGAYWAEAGTESGDATRIGVAPRHSSPMTTGCRSVPTMSS